jgi:hypothetical protein
MRKANNTIVIHRQPFRKSTIYSYNLDDSKTPGGIKVRWKIRVVGGLAAAR